MAEILLKVALFTHSQGCTKLRNEIETQRTKQNETKRNITQRNILKCETQRNILKSKTKRKYTKIQ